MFSIDSFDNLQPLSIYLARPSGKAICCIDGDIDGDEASLSIGLNQQWELQFSVTNDYAHRKTSYDALQEGMYLFVEKVGLFKMRQPAIENDGARETKSVVAYSCEAELEDKNCTLSFNMGVPTSQEYLVAYEDGETESLVSPYTGIPYDWIVVYNTFPEQLSKLLADYDGGRYGARAENGDVVVKDAALVKELLDIFDTIPRLKSKITETADENQVRNAVLTEYAILSYDAAGEEVTGITLTKDFGPRVEYLIGFYERYRPQLSLLLLALEPTGGAWQVGDVYGVADGDYSLANRKYQFESDETIYSFLTHTFAEASRCIVTFDRVTRKVNVTPVEKVGRDTGIVLSYDNLVNALRISCSDDALTTRLYVSGADDMGIRQVNFGLDYIDDISYKLNARDGNGNRVYVDDALAEKYARFAEEREKKRERYVELSKEYSECEQQIYDIRYRVPNDGLKTDWGTFTYEELQGSLITYKNLLASLETLYKEDYGELGLNGDGSINEGYIKDTPYWYDYKAYKDTILEIECACHTFPYYSDQSKWDATDLAQYKDKVNAWETEWSLYGIIELQAKIDAYTSDMQILAEQSVIRTAPNADTIKKWSELTEDERESFGFLEANYFYDAYMKYYNYRESAKEYLKKLQGDVAALEERKEQCQSERVEIADSARLESNFTEGECRELNLLFRDSSYENDNILITSIDDNDDASRHMMELLEDGRDRLSVLCRPQLSFEVDADNLLGIADFAPFWKDFEAGNYVLVQYRDETYARLRMVGFQFNPRNPYAPDFKISFSNYVRSRTSVSDLESLLGLSASGGSSGGSGSSGGGSGDGYGESDDIDVTISNTMLSKLLNSEMFGTRVTNIILDTVDANSITAKFAKFEGLAKGTTIIDGKCITTGYIVDMQYNGKDGDINNTAGSVVNLETGKFSFAGGKLKFDGNSLSVEGSIVADSGYIGGKSGFVIGPGKLYSNGHSAYNSSVEGVYIGTDYIALGKGGITYFKNDGTGKIGAWNFSSDAIYRGSPSFGAASGMYFGTQGLSIGSAFRVDSSGNLSINSSFKVTSDGHLTATNATITGDITATNITATQKGRIACWTIDSSSLSYNSNTFKAANGMYFGTQGLSISNVFSVDSKGNLTVTDKFKVTSDGHLTAQSASIVGDIDAEKMVARDAYYICDEDFDENVKVISCPGDGSTNTGVYRFGRLTSPRGSTADSTAMLHYIGFSDTDAALTPAGNIRKCDLYTDLFRIHSDVHMIDGGSIYLDDDDDTDANDNGMQGAKSAGLSSQCVGKLIWHSHNDGGESNKDMIDVGNKNHIISINGSAIHHNDSATSQFQFTSTASDRRLKDHVSYMDELEGFYMRLKPACFKYRDGLYDARGGERPIRWGFYAQDVLDAFANSGIDPWKYNFVVEEMVDVSDAERKCLDDTFEGVLRLGYQEMAALNAHMVQKALRENEALAARVAELEGRVARMEGAV